MNLYPMLPGDFIAPAYTYGAAKYAYETYGGRGQKPRDIARKPYPFTTIEGMRRIDFDNGSFEVFL